MWKKSEPDAAQRVDARRRAQMALDAITDEEDAAITAAALADPDAQPVDDLFRRRRGRPQASKEEKKVAVSLKLDPDLVQSLRESGAGWQTRVNSALRKAFLPETAARRRGGMK